MNSRPRLDQRIVTIFGTSHASPGDEAYDLAADIGRGLATAGLTIANGGYGGTMLAAAEAAVGAGGRVIGVTCSMFRRAGANAFVTDEVVAASLDERLHTLVTLGGAYVVLPGGTGTLLELAMVWELKNRGLRRNSLFICRSDLGQIEARGLSETGGVVPFYDEDFAIEERPKVARR
jgi:uncharacterized protein (TIGR00725 family)